MTLKEEVALSVLCEMIKTPGDRVKKVIAAFDYADLFMRESERRKKVESNESKNFASLPRSLS